MNYSMSPGSVCCYLDSPIGRIRISGNEEAITEVHFLDDEKIPDDEKVPENQRIRDNEKILEDEKILDDKDIPNDKNIPENEKIRDDEKSDIPGRKSPAPDLIIECRKQLSAYFNGKSQQFNIRLNQQGTDFQQKVWNRLSAIPYGDTINYLALARQLGDPKVIRAAAAANGKNNIAIIVPCHRVIGSNGDLVGYAGGLWRKRWLLDHEKKFARGVQTLF